MKVYLVFNARKSSENEAKNDEALIRRNDAIEEASAKSFLNPVMYDWKYPVLPNKGDLVKIADLKDEEDSLPVPGYFYEAIGWKKLDYHVDHITWCFLSGEIIPRIHLLGE